jgi:septum formation protein
MRLLDLGGAPLVLASQSPRRREILDQVGIPFRVHAPKIDEQPRAGERPADYVLRVAHEKARAAAADLNGSVILAADTTVTIDGAILGKPLDAEDARRMLTLLSGRVHEVLTAVAVIHQPSGREAQGIDSTRVWFSEIDPATIDAYLKREDVTDKAGAYAIQGFASLFIPRIEGNYLNVVGLPLPLAYALIARCVSGTAD